jgi:hypothetical protein
MLLTIRRPVGGVPNGTRERGNIQKYYTESDLSTTRSSDESTKARSVTDSDIGDRRKTLSAHGPSYGIEKVGEVLLKRHIQ